MHSRLAFKHQRDAVDGSEQQAVHDVPASTRVDDTMGGVRHLAQPQSRRFTQFRRCRQERHCTFLLRVGQIIQIVSSLEDGLLCSASLGPHPNCSGSRNAQTQLPHISQKRSVTDLGDAGFIVEFASIRLRRGNTN